VIDLLIGFSVGFSCALLLICRVTIRPSARKALKQIGLAKKHKAKVIGKKDEWEM
jgi:hypothetical protein